MCKIVLFVFVREHAKFQTRLASQKKTFHSTKPVGFRFSKKKKSSDDNPDMFSLFSIDIDKDDESKNVCHSPNQKQIHTFMNKVPKYIPKSTKKFDQAIAKRIEKERIKEVEKLVLRQARKQKEREKKQRWKGKLHGVLHDNSKELEFGVFSFMFVFVSIEFCIVKINMYVLFPVLCAEKSELPVKRQLVKNKDKMQEPGNERKKNL